MMAEASTVYINTNEHLRANTEVETREDRSIKKLKIDYPAHQYRKSAPIMHRIRSVKELEELELLQKACNITEAGFRRLLGFIQPGVWEYEIEAELAHEFLRNRSKGFAYTPIVASGKSACVLHYIENNKQCLDGDMILLDVGAEYANYASDLTRCVPVNGRFTARQKQVYNAVLHVKKEAEKLPEGTAAATPVWLETTTDWAPGSSGSALIDPFGNAVGHVSEIQSVVEQPLPARRKSGAATTAPQLGTQIIFHQAIGAVEVRALVRKP
jgi:hypothetical protein